VHDPALGQVVGERVVLGQAVVPERDIAGPPAPADGEFELGDVLEA
jgi:hypothetical protein